jgi:TDG/mug DNA glycosylase family protein
VDDDTIAVYERHAAEWEARRRPARLADAAAFATRAGGGPVADLGCGPGWQADALAHGPGASRRPVVALDAAAAMLSLVPRHAPDALRVRGDLAALPFARGALAGGWAGRSYVHLARADLPLALWDLQRACTVGAPVELHLFGGDQEHGPIADDDFAGRRFSRWPEQLLSDVVTGGGFDVDAITRHAGRDGIEVLTVQAVRARTLADTVGPGMRMLMVGLNPSLHAADAGVGFSRPGNRFWPAAIAAGIAERDRDARHALLQHGMGMTDLVKRASPRADVLTAAEYGAGLERLERLVAWLRPRLVCLVGLAGWRAAVDRTAVPGAQATELGGRPVYVMPSTSGANANHRLDDLVEHLRAAARLAAESWDRLAAES